MLPLCALLGVLFAGFFPKLDAQEGKFREVCLSYSQGAESVDDMPVYNFHFSAILIGIGFFFLSQFLKL